MNVVNEQLAKISYSIINYKRVKFLLFPNGNLNKGDMYK